MSKFEAVVLILAQVPSLFPVSVTGGVVVCVVIMLIICVAALRIQCRKRVVRTRDIPSPRADGTNAKRPLLVSDDDEFA